MSDRTFCALLALAAIAVWYALPRADAIGLVFLYAIVVGGVLSAIARFGDQ